MGVFADDSIGTPVEKDKKLRSFYVCHPVTNSVSNEGSRPEIRTLELKELPDGDAAKLSQDEDNPLSSQSTDRKSSKWVAHSCRRAFRETALNAFLI